MAQPNTIMKALRDMNWNEANLAQRSAIAALKEFGIEFNYDATSSASEIWNVNNTTYFIRGKNDTRNIRGMVEVKSHTDMLIQVSKGI